MRREIRELDRFDLSRPSAGEVAPWVRGVVSGAALAMIAVAAVAARCVWREDRDALALDEGWFQNGLAFGLALAVGAAVVPPARTSRFVRLAVLLPLILLGALAAAWTAWTVLAPRLVYIRNHAPLVFDVPAGAALVAALGATGAAALAIERRSLEAWSRTFVVLALVELLLLGLWLPLASWWWQGREGVEWAWLIDRGQFLLGPAPVLLALALAPPFLAAVAFAAAAARRPELVHRTRAAWGAALAALFVLAVIARLAASDTGYFVYLNLVHFLAASAAVAAIALGVLVGGLWWRGRRVRLRLARERAPVVGVIAGEPLGSDGVVACLELAGWLPGLRPLVDAFEVVTPAGRLPIPIGAALAAAVPPMSSVLHTGEAVAVLRRGDRVVIGGLVEPAPDHPFRSSSALIPGPAGVVVRRHDDRDDGFATAALVAWRPCVAFLGILAAIAVPGLAAVLSLW